MNYYRIKLRNASYVGRYSTKGRRKALYVMSIIHDCIELTIDRQEATIYTNKDQSREQLDQLNMMLMGHIYELEESEK